VPPPGIALESFSTIEDIFFFLPPVGFFFLDENKALLFGRVEESIMISRIHLPQRDWEYLESSTVPSDMKNLMEALVDL